MRGNTRRSDDFDEGNNSQFLKGRTTTSKDLVERMIQIPPDQVKQLESIHEKPLMSLTSEELQLE